jgi:hypothetical protein
VLGAHLARHAQLSNAESLSPVSGRNPPQAQNAATQ